ncbi:MAG: hypothetical protein IPN95_20570 [Bacteroidetes bacterium]|nr:hypothetical protein [Bacteroidota bacterium]
MNRSHFLILLTTLFISFSACKPRKDGATTPPKPPVNPNPVVFCGSELSRGRPSFQDPLLSVKAMVQGDCLRLTAEYSGGCQEHDFDMYWDGEWDRTKPPVAHLYLGHNAHGDACEAIKAEKIGFSLEQIRFPGNGQVIADIHAAGASLTRVSYTY